jgi:membrane complex biogenesis BtpA family protein
LKALEAGGIQTAVVENMFDVPYAIVPDLETIIAKSYVLGYLKDKTNINLGVNVQATSGTEEMSTASICGVDFIRAETFVEMRMNSAGLMQNMCAELTRKKHALHSSVRIIADINVKHSSPVIQQPIDRLNHQAIEAGPDRIILTGLATGSARTVSDAEIYKKICGDTSLYIGGGVNTSNIRELMHYADGAIVGSSIKVDGKVENPVDIERVKDLIRRL